MAQKVNYHHYLKVGELLSLQEELSNPKHPDELLFIIIHQSHELWFKLIIHELKRLKVYISKSFLYEAFQSIDRILAIFKSLIKQIDVLHTLTPDEFLGYRDLLSPASGFQSYQYKIIEFLCGLKDKGYIEIHRERQDIYSILKEYLEATSVWDQVILLLQTNKFSISDQMMQRDFAESYTASPEVVSAIKEVYMNRSNYQGLHYLFEKLVELDLTLQIWRTRHCKNAERAIGLKQGTGGSKGMEYLQAICSRKLFPELWDVRSVL